MFLTFASAIEYAALDRGIHDQIWAPIFQNFNQNLKAFEDLRYISLDNNNLCLQLKQKNVKYYHHKDVWNMEIIGFIVASGSSQALCPDASCLSLLSFPMVYAITRNQPNILRNSRQRI
jgi:hypothetical protein